MLCIADHIQDAVLLIDVGGVMFANFNDAAVRFCRRFVKSVIGRFDRRFMLKLSGYGDVDMINLYDEDGARIEPAAASKPSVGGNLATHATYFDFTDVVPFSFFHRYQRADSIWAEQYATPLAACREGFFAENITLHDAFIRYDCERDEVTAILCAQTPEKVYEPEHFGDSWSDQLEPADARKLDAYFRRIEFVRGHYGFLRFVVGGREHRIELDGPSGRGITFETPRGSLMTSVEYEIFDDLLIGNFMKTTLHGVRSLYDPNFNFHVSKYADNGKAHTRAQVREHMMEYRGRSQGEWRREELVTTVSDRVRRYVPFDSALYRNLIRVYHKLR